MYYMFIYIHLKTNVIEENFLFKQAPPERASRGGSTVLPKVFCQ